MWSLSQTSAPAEAALSTERVVSHCRISLDQPGCDAATVAGWIAAATVQAEARTGRQLINATYEMHLDCWPLGRIAIPKAPLRSVTHVKYYAPGESALTTWAAANYIVFSPAGPKAQNGYISLAPRASYPTVEDKAGAIVVTFVAGYGDSEDDVPEGIKQGMLVRIAAMNELREDAAGAFSTRDGETAARLWSSYITYMPEMVR